MSTIDPPVPPTTPQPVTLPKAIVVAPPPGLSSLNIGTKLDGIVAQIITPTNVVLSTNFGDITLNLPARLPITLGQPVLIQLLSGGAQPKVQLSAPGGGPLPTQGNIAQPAISNIGGATTKAANQPVVETALGAASNASLAIGKAAVATLLRPISLTPNLFLATPSTAIASAPAGTPTVTANAPQSGGAQTAAQPAATGAISGTTQPTPTGASGTTSTPGAQPTVPSTTVPAGSSLSVVITAIKPPEGSNPPLNPPPFQGPLSLSAGATLTGVVTGKQGVGPTLIQTHIGPLALPTTETLPKGTQVTMQIVSLQPASTSIKSHLLPMTADPLSGGTWPALDEAMLTLNDIAPAAHAHIAQTAIPRGDAQFMANVLFFVAALRGGDLKGWMGDGPLRILERQRPDLLSRLRDDLGQMSRIVNDPDTGDWRMHAVPYLNGEEIDRIRMLVRDRGDEPEEDSDKPGGTRFVIDLNLTRLGHLQIDGLVATGGKRVDVILRTNDPLESVMRDDIRRLYTNALEVTGIEGSVGFQSAPGNFVGIPEQMLSDLGTNAGVVI